MGRHSKSNSYRHSIQPIGDDHYRLHWTVDRYYSGSRLRHPSTTQRDTDRRGAERFAKRWNLMMPNVKFSGGAPLHGAASAGTKG